MFGEPSLALGVLLLAASLYLWKRGEQIVGVAKLVGVTRLVTGKIFLLFGTMNFCTRIGLIVNTMQ